MTFFPSYIKKLPPNLPAYNNDKPNKHAQIKFCYAFTHRFRT